MSNFRKGDAATDGKPQVIVLEGTVDVDTAPQLKQQMITLLESDQSEIILDVSKVEYLDSTALGVIIGGCKRCREKNGDLAVVCPDPRIRRVFEITGLDKIFPVKNTLVEAQESLAKTAATA